MQLDKIKNVYQEKNLKIHLRENEEKKNLCLIKFIKR